VRCLGSRVQHGRKGVAEMGSRGDVHRYENKKRLEKEWVQIKREPPKIGGENAEWGGRKSNRKQKNIAGRPVKSSQKSTNGCRDSIRNKEERRVSTQHIKQKRSGTGMRPPRVSHWTPKTSQMAQGTKKTKKKENWYRKKQRNCL